MGKYGDLIQQAKAEASDLESQKAAKAENQTARKPERPKARKMENQKTRLLDNQADEMVNLGVKVPLGWRRHWAAESKRRGVSMTDVIIEALTKRFGKPE